MKRKKILLITLCSFVGIGLVTNLLIPKNTPIIAHFLNKNSIDVEVRDGLSKEKIKIELSILGTDFEDITILENESTNSIPKGYGENDWFFSYDQKKQGVFRHFKTNNWHDHHYYFVFYRKNEEILCDIQIDGPDQREKITIPLDKEIKIDTGS